MMLNEIDIYSNEETPYFQTTDKYRIRFVYNLFYKYRNRELLRDIIHTVTSEDTQIKATFCVASYNGGKRYSKKSGIGKLLKIINWKETVREYDEGDSAIVYAAIIIQKEHVCKLIANVIEDRIDGPIIFCAENYIIYVSTDVIDIIHRDYVIIRELKSTYSILYDKYHET
jgi:hypothetical protein